jgi:hypothetical protein
MSTWPARRSDAFAFRTSDNGDIWKKAESTYFSVSFLEPCDNEQYGEHKKREPHHNGSASILLSYEEAQVPHPDPPDNKDRSSKSFVHPNDKKANQEEGEQDFDDRWLGPGSAVLFRHHKKNIQECVDGG